MRDANQSPYVRGQIVLSRETLGTVSMILVGIFTVVGGLLGIFQGNQLLSLYLLRQGQSIPNPAPPLNIVGPARIVLGFTSIILGVAFVVVATVKLRWNRVVWIGGVTIYAVFLVLSIAQVWDYWATASYGGENTMGISEAVVGFLIISYLLSPGVREFFIKRRVRGN